MLAVICPQVGDAKHVRGLLEVLTMEWESVLSLRPDAIVSPAARSEFCVLRPGLE